VTPKRVAIDLRMVGRVPHGIARYALALWNQLPERADLHYLALCRAEGLPSISARRARDEIWPTRSGFVSPLEQVELPLVLRQARADLLHATSFAVPLAWRGPLVVSIHDLTHLRFPELHGPGRRAYYRFFVGPSARRATAVLTESEFEKEEIARRLGVARQRLHSAPLAIELGMAGRPPLESRPPPTSPPTLLYVGNGKPHKNVELLAQVMPLLRQPARLVLAGEGLERFAGSAIEVRTQVGDAALIEAYRSATLFLSPSRSEGFGLPPLEAAWLGTPVIVADTTVLAEIWKGVAPLLSPDDPRAWAEEIDRLLGDAAARQELADRCAAHADRYTSWTPLMDLAERSYREALADSH
jgi:glycosyltransferase involved in cell wall biosynthesis